MDYQKIKERMREADRLVREGKVAEADAYVRATRGATPLDVTTNICPASLAELRRFSKRKGKV